MAETHDRPGRAEDEGAGGRGVEGGGAAGKRTRVEAAYPTLARAMRSGGAGADDAAGPSIHDAATAAVEHKGSGGAVDSGVAARVGAHLGADLSGVRVHQDALATEASAAMGARAFAHGADVFLGAGESGGDLGLMAHELTHVAQQGAAGQRAPQRKVEVGDANSPAEHEADAVAAAVTGGAAPGTLLVDDGPVAPGQMLKSTFMAELRTAVTAAADAELGPVMSAMGCPYIDQYFRRYATRSAAEGEALLRRFAPGVRGAREAQAMIPVVVERVRAGVAVWRDTGQAPPEIAAMEPGAAAAAGAASGAGGAQALRAPDGSETLASLEAELGPGTALDGATASRMSGALGVDVSAARIHTGPVAAAKAAVADAVAFTVGPNIVMGAGIPAAGTLERDALLAHELAHTVQQAAAAQDPAARRQPIGGESATAEAHADGVVEEAAKAEAGKAGKAGADKASLASRLLNTMTTGLRLQRCGKVSAPAPPVAHKVTDKAGAGGTDLMAGTETVTDKEQSDVDTILNPSGGGGVVAPKPFVAAGFEADLQKALDDWRKSTTAWFNRLKGKDAFKLDMPQVQQTGIAAQQVVTDAYGSYVQGATFNADTNARKPGYSVGDPTVLHPQEDSIDPLPVGDQESIVVGLVEYASVQGDGGQPVMDAHNCDRSRGPDQAAYDKVVQAFAKKHFKELVEIQRMWPGEEHPWDGTVYIQLRREKDASLSKKEKGKDAKYADANLRRGYWSTFQTLIHEYLHACAHAELQNAANTNRGLTHQILIEGGCDFYTEKIWTKLEPTLSGNAALREKVEGKPYPYVADVIPGPGYYDEKEDVKQIVAKLGANGEANFAAAYFMGHTELIGLGGWKKGSEKDADTFVAPAADYALATVSARCYVDEDVIASANSLAVGAKVAAGTRLKVPGIRHHLALDGDTKAAIGTQHAVTESALDRANPGTAWGSLAAGTDILIPVH